MSPAGGVRSIAVLGDAFVDVMAAHVSAAPAWGADVQCGAVTLEAGGSALNTATHLKSLEPSWPVTVYCCIGEADFGAQIVADHCSKHQVALVAVRKPMPTGTCIVLSGSKDRAFVSNSGASGAWTQNEVPIRDIALSAQHLHIGGVFNLRALAPSLPNVVEQLRALNPALTVSLDTNYDSTKEWGRAYMPQLLALVDVCKVNEVEALGISGEADLTVAVRWLASRVRILAIITLGEAGAMACLHSDLNDIIKVSSPKIDVVDAVGAGDAFNSGFIASFTQQQDVATALRYACACGALNVTRIGASKTPVTQLDISQLTVDEVADDESMVCIVT